MMIPKILSNSAYFGPKFQTMNATASSNPSNHVADSLKKMEANLISFLEKNLPRDMDTSFLNSGNLEKLEFEKKAPYAAVISYQGDDQEGGASKGPWELNNMDPGTLSRIEADFATYKEAKERESRKTDMPVKANSEASARARLYSGGEKKKPVMACIFGGQGHTHRIHQQVVQKIFRKAYGDKFVIKSLDLKVTGIIRDEALQKEYDATNRDPELSDAKLQEQMKTPQMQKMTIEVEKLLAEIDPDVIFSNYDTIARIAMQKLKEKYGEDRPSMVQHLSDLGVMHIRWILKEFAEENSKDLVLTSGRALMPGESDQQKFVLNRGVPPERVIHTGAPVRSDFNEVREMSKGDCRKELREQYGIDIPDGKMAFLTMSGSGFWPEKFFAANEVLAHSDLVEKIHLVPIAGDPQETKEKLRAIIPSSINILGLTQGRKLALLQRGVDLNLIKGGGGGIPEVTNLNRAFLVYDALPGPEPENAKFVREQGIGLVALITKNKDGTYNTDAFMKAIRNIVEHPEILEQIEEDQKAHIVEDSAERIADILHRTGMEHYEAKMKREALAHAGTSQDIQELD